MKIWKRTAFALALVLLFVQEEPVLEPMVASATSKTQKEIDEAQKEKDKLQNELDETEENLDRLEGKRDSLEKELSYLRSQMNTVVTNLEELDRLIREKEQEIADTQAALEEALATEEWQQASMAAMVRCMYEKPEDSYLTALLSAGSLADLLNMADRMEKVAAYDQKMLEAYQNNRMLIEEQEARLEAERTQLEGLIAQAKEEEAKVSALIDQASSSISKYSGQISEAEQKALAYEEKIRKKEEDLEYLKKKLAEEIAMSQAAANGTWRDISEVTFSEGDRKLLANLIYCEAGGEPYEGQLAVGSVVINRVLSSKYPDTLGGVVYQSGQFSPVASGRLELALATDKATDRCYQAADVAMSGVTNVGNCVYFRTPIEGLSGINIGGHVFY